MPSHLRLVEANSIPAPSSNTSDPATAYVERLAAGSRRTMREAIGVLRKLLSTQGHELAWHRLRYEHVAALRAVLVSRYKPNTANKILAALRGVLRESWKLGQLSAEDCEKAVSVESVKGLALPRGRALVSGELRVLFETCAKDRAPAGRRDAALVAVLYGTGVRRAEAVALDVSDYDATSGAVTVRSGKGGKDRITYASAGTRTAIASWLALRGDAAGPLFMPVNKAGKIVAHPITDQAVLFILRRRAKQAGVSKFSPHDLRRTFVSDLLDAGADIATVQRLAGHASVVTTARYDRRGEATKLKAVELLHVPFVPAATTS